MIFDAPALRKRNGGAVRRPRRREEVDIIRDAV